MLVLALFACTAEDLSALNLPVEDLSDEGAVHTARVLDAGAVWLTDDEVRPVLPQTNRFFWVRNAEVTDWSEDRIQVVAVDDDYLTLRVWLDREDLQTRTYTETLGWSGQGEVDLPAGWPVEPLWEEEGLTRVAVQSHQLDIEVFLESADLDQMWLPKFPRAWALDETGEEVYALEGSALLEEPGGEAFAWFGPSFYGEGVYSHPAELLDIQDGHALVRVVDPPVVVVGWIADWSDYRNGFSGSSACGGMLLGRGDGGPAVVAQPDVPADTALLAADGTLIGRTKVGLTVDLGSQNARGLRSMDVDTSWGTVEVWVEVD